MPLVFSITWRIGRRRAARTMSMILRVQRRLTAGNLQQIRLAFAFDQQVEHRLDFGETALPGPVRRRIGEADRASQVAVFVDLDQRQAAVLLVVGAEPAIVRAAPLDRGVELEWHVAGLQKIAAALPVRRLARHQRLLHAVLAAALLVVHGTGLFDDLRRYQGEAGLAHRRGLAEKHIRPRPARRRGRRCIKHSRCRHNRRNSR
jgi:hypothetical protein